MSAAGSAGNGATWSGMTARAVVSSTSIYLRELHLSEEKWRPLHCEDAHEISAERSRPRRIESQPA
jgi:hypothetical protein